LHAYERMYLWHNNEFKPLSLTNPTHTKRSLCVVPKGHVFSQRQRRQCIDSVLDVDPGGVYLIMMRKFRFGK
jgi:hypothetical protein